MSEKFLSIPKVAALGILNAKELRRMQKEGKLPCIFTGPNKRRILVNVDALVEQLKRQSLKNQEVT